MTVVAIVCQAFAFYMLYNTSKRAELLRDSLSAWLQDHALFSKIAGLVLLFVSFVILAAVQGVGVGIFVGFLSLMTIGSLIVLLIPLRKKPS